MLAGVLLTAPRIFAGTAPAIVVQPEAVVQVTGKSVTFRVTAEGAPEDGALAYQWFFNGAPVGGAAAKKAAYAFAATEARAGDYFVRVTNKAGSSDSDPAALTVLTRPKITSQPAGLTLDAGQPLSLTVVAAGNPAPAYQWFHDGAPISGATSATYRVDAADALDTGAYQVSVANSVATVPSRTVSVVVRSAPVIVDSPSDTDAYVGTPLRLSVVAAGFPARSYQWRFNGAPVSGARSAVFVLSPTLAKTGVYDVVVTNALGSATATPFTVTVNAAPKVAAAPLAARKRAGQSHVFEVVAPAHPAPSFQWFKNGVELPKQTLGTLALSPLTLADDGLYSVRVGNDLGAVTTKPVRLEVSLSPYGPVSGGTYRLGGFWRDSDGDSGSVDETYAFTKDGGLAYHDFTEGTSFRMSRDSFTHASATARGFSGSITIQGVKFTVTLRFTHTSATAGAYTLKGSAPSVGYTVNQSGAFTYTEPGL